jgi:hypothetical protein
MAERIPEAEALGFYRAVEAGDITLSFQGEDPQEIYSGVVSYRASNGWRIDVFNDCNEFDYIDRVVDDRNRQLEFDDIETTRLDWNPPELTAWKCFGLPGHHKYRCVKCGTLIERNPRYLCKRDRCSGTKLPLLPTLVKPATW